MNKHTAAKRLPLICLCLGIGVLTPILAGCHNGAKGPDGHDLTAADFKNTQPPPEAMKAMQEAQKHAGPGANGGPGAAPGAAPSAPK